MNMNMNSRTVFAAIAAIVFVLIFGIAITVSQFSSDVSDVRASMHEADSVLLNSQVIIKNDTFDIIRTNWMYNTIVIDNGMELDFMYVDSRLYPESSVEFFKNRAKK